MSQKRKRKQLKNIIDIADYYPKKIIHNTPKTENQKEYYNLIQSNHTDIILGVGPSGTGKTLLAVESAIQGYMDKRFNKIVITRPAVSIDEQHGFLPGNLNQKMEPWVQPIIDVFNNHFYPHEVDKMIAQGDIEIAPLAYMRGRTFKDAFIIGDEMQNATASQMKMLLTRIGDRSKMVITGDLAQADREHKNGLLDFIKLMREGTSHRICLQEFDRTDVQRHPVVKEVLRLYRDY